MEHLEAAGTQEQDAFDTTCIALQDRCAAGVAVVAFYNRAMDRLPDERMSWTRDQQEEAGRLARRAVVLAGDRYYETAVEEARRARLIEVKANGNAGLWGPFVWALQQLEKDEA